MMDNYSTLFESDFRKPEVSVRGHIRLNTAVFINSKIAREDIYLLSVNSEAPSLKKEGVLAKIPMGNGFNSEITDYLIEGIENAKRIAKDLNNITKKPVGICRHEDLAFSTHISAQSAIKDAEIKNNPYHIYSRAE